MVSTTGLKVCGVTHEADLDACIAAGVDAVGLNFWSGSSRAIDVATGRALVQRARAAGSAIELVGVFVDRDPAQVAELAAQVGLDAIQPHGDRPGRDYAELGLPWVWVVRGTPDLATLKVPTPAPAWALLDAHVPGYGGRGVTTDWDWAAQAVRHLAPLPVWLAGGIGPDNAADAIARVAPAGLDVASGAQVSGDPRRKDAGKIAALVSICQNRPAR